VIEQDTTAVGDGTRCVHGGRTGDGIGEPLHAGPVLAAAYHLGPPEAPTPVDFYGRSANPTWRALEAAIGELDGGHTVLFASGMAAISATLRLLCRPGSAVVLPADGYYLARTLAKIQTRAMNEGDHICRNEEVWYQPLTKVAHAMPVYALAHDFKGQGLGTTWSRPDKRSSFIGNFAVPSE